MKLRRILSGICVSLIIITSCIDFKGFTVNAASSVELYKEVLDMFYDNISNGWKDCKKEDTFGSNSFNAVFNAKESYSAQWDTDDLSQAGYNFTDINKDGIDELLVTSFEYYNYNDYNGVLDIYTIYNGQIMHVASSLYRLWFKILDDYSVLQDSLGGVNYDGHSKNHIVNGKLEAFEYYDFERESDTPYTFSNEKKYDQETGREVFVNFKPISEEEYNASKNALTLDFTPFSDYKSGGVQDNGLKASGNCGENVTWKLYNDGTLNISGTGDMYDYCCESILPFKTDSPFSEREDIKSVVIENGVISIGNWLFPKCTNIESITIPDSVKSMGNCFREANFFQI